MMSTPSINLAKEKGDDTLNTELNQTFIFSERLQVGQSTYDVVSKSGNNDRNVGDHAFGEDDYLVLKYGRSYMGKLTFHSDCSYDDKVMLAQSVISSDWFDLLTHKQFDVRIEEDSLKSIQSLRDVGVSNDLACAAAVTFQILTQRTDARVDDAHTSVASLYEMFLDTIQQFDDADEIADQLFEPWMNVYYLRQEGIANRLLKINKSVSERRELFRYVDSKRPSLFDHHYDLDFSDSALLVFITMDNINFALSDECIRSLFTVFENFSREQWEELDSKIVADSALSTEQVSEGSSKYYKMSRYLDFSNFPLMDDLIPHLGFIESLLTVTYGQDRIEAAHQLIESSVSEETFTVHDLIAICCCLERDGDTKAPLEWITNLYSV